MEEECKRGEVVALASPPIYREIYWLSRRGRTLPAQADYLLKDAKRLVQYTPFESGRFKPLSGGRAVFYTSDISGDGAVLGQVLAFIEEKNGTTLITSSRSAGRARPNSPSSTRASAYPHRAPSSSTAYCTCNSGWRSAAASRRSKYARRVRPESAASSATTGSRSVRASCRSFS